MQAAAAGETPERQKRANTAEKRGEDMQETDISRADYWAGRYQRGETAWDLGAPCTVFQDALARGLLPFPGNPDRARHVLTPGCGNGHDAEVFARRGYRVTALDFAPEPLANLQRRIEGQKLPITTLRRDVFALTPADLAPVDIVLEYTMYCAIDPQRREDYLGVLAALLQPDAVVAALLFPLGTPNEGPPFAIDPDEYEAQWAAHGLRVEHRETPRASHPARSGNELLMILRNTAAEGGFKRA